MSEKASIVNELNIYDGQQVSIVGFEDENLAELLEAMGIKIVDPKLSGNRDHFFVYMDSVEATITIGILIKRLNPEGAIWAVFPKENKEINEKDIVKAAENKGLKCTFKTDYEKEYKLIKIIKG